MALKTINDYVSIPVRAADDELLIYDVSTGITRKIAVDDLLGAIISGGATLVVSGASVINGQLLGAGMVDTNGFTLNVDSDSTIDGSLDAGGGTLTVPATGTAALLGQQQSFTQQQTIAPTDAADDGLILNMPTGSTNGVGWRVQYNGTSRIFVEVKSDSNALAVSSFDNGSSNGALVTVGRNSNGSTPAPGAIGIRRSNNTISYLWPDDSGVLRAATSPPTNATMGGGSVIGDQTSHIAYKNIVGDSITPEQAAYHVMEAAQLIKRFTYKDGRYNSEEFSGIILDGPELHRYGMDADKEHPAGKALNVITAIGDLILTGSWTMQKLAEFARATAELVNAHNRLVDMNERLVSQMEVITNRLAVVEKAQSGSA